MANTRELRRRIRSVKNTSQITRAMQMVAATKMRKAQLQALSGRPYSLTLSESMRRLLPSMHPEAHPLLNPNEGKQTAVILLSTDKSLCGALNTNLFRLLQNTLKDPSNLIFYTVGKKGRDFVVRTDRKLEADFENPEMVTFHEATQIAKIAIDSYTSSQVKEVYLSFPQFVSTLRQEPKMVKLLPIDKEELQSVVESSRETSRSYSSNEVRRSSSASDEVASSAYSSNEVRSSRIRSNNNDNSNNEFLFEPNVTELLHYILVHFIETKIYQSLLETKASEHSARMIAMQNATDNAKDLVTDLNLAYNQTRQNAITKELLEITTGAAALE